MTDPHNPSPDSTPAPASPDGVALARLIHDDVLQSLAVSLLSVELCRRALAAGDHPAAQAELDLIAESIDSAATALRGVMTRLHGGAR